jgi:hypothetical protein
LGGKKKRAKGEEKARLMNKLLFQIAKIRSMFNHQQSIIFFHLIDSNANEFQHWQRTRIKRKATLPQCLIIAQNINLHICTTISKNVSISYRTRSICANISDMHTTVNGKMILQSLRNGGQALKSSGKTYIKQKFSLTVCTQTHTVNKIFH